MENKDLDVIIVGAGPAGLSAAIWCGDLGLKALVLEMEAEPGGQLLSIHNPITNYPGVKAANGLEMLGRLLETAEGYGVEILSSMEVVDLDAGSMSVTTAGGGRFAARAIVFASGVRRRRLNIPGESEFAGRGIIESGSRDKASTRGKTVAIIGGGDAAVENAVILSDYAEKIYLIHRGDAFSAREEFIRAAAEDPRIECRFRTVVSRINGEESVRSIEMVYLCDDSRHELDVDVVLIRIGVEPNSRLLAGAGLLDENGYSRAFRAGQGSMIFPVGDVADPVAMTIASAVGSGASAAKRIYHLLKNAKPL